jgi:PTH1 family peptidyl-tRNA hydrolase
MRRSQRVRNQQLKTRMIQLIVGLANPGPEYASTRHNAGAWFVEALLGNTSLKTESKLFCQMGTLTLHGQPCRVMIPSTYMNESGKALLAVAQFYKIPPENILVAHDELDLPVGTTRLKLGGGHGGHNGLRHIIQMLGTPHFHRLRIGIGHPGNAKEVVDYVLKRPRPEEKTAIDESIMKALQVMPDVMQEKIQEAMKKLHTP